MRGLAMGVVLVVMVIAGCGGDDKPTSPSGTLHAMGLVGVSPDGSTEALVVVKDGGVAVHDAAITLNGIPVPIDPYGDGYYWSDSLTVSPGDHVTLRVVTAHGDLTQETTVPAFVQISTPSNGAVFADDQEIQVAWNNVPDVSVVQVNYYEDDVYPLCFAELPVGSVSYMIPAVKTVVGTNTISVSAMRGAGSRPLDASRWNGESGFWVNSRDEIEVTVSPQTGSCCTYDGSCMVTTQGQCTGTWTPEGTCTPNPCSAATGSCCAPDGTCTVTEQAGCPGYWMPLGACAPNPCPQPATGSCCAADGSCTVTVAAGCTENWTADGRCEPNLCVARNGSIVGWGGNVWGQCDVPAPNADFVAIATGQGHSLGLKTDGVIVAWGANDVGQCDVPAPDSGFVAVAAGRLHSIGLKADGTIVSWGANEYGQCDVPAPNEDFWQIASGRDHNVGIKLDGTIVAWGLNTQGQCDVPPNARSFIDVAAGQTFSLGLTESGSIVAWGSNTSGQCDVPEPNTGFVRMAAGGWHGLGQKSDGSFVAWGLNDHGQCNIPSPQSSYLEIAGGGSWSLGLTYDGVVHAWGASASLPSPNAGFVAISAGIMHNLALHAR